MSILVSVNKVSKSFGRTTLFNNLSFGLDEKTKLGLIGANGSGKSTLLKLLASLEEPDEGEITKRSGLNLIYLAQSDIFDESLSVHDAIVQSLEKNISDKIERDVLANKILNLAGFTDTTQSIKSLSGGWKKRLAIARSIIQKPDILLLDEPTNHLDIESRLWLEGLLQRANFAFVVISHDRTLLQNVCEETMELSRQYPEGYLRLSYPYEKFLDVKADFLEGQLKEEMTLKNKVRRETEWLRKGPKARTTKAKSRIQDAYELEKEFIEVKQRNRSNKSIGVGFEHSQNETRMLIKLRKISKSFGDKNIISDFNFTLNPGKRIGLLGSNGCGKSTLIKIIEGKLEPDQGTVKPAYELKIVSFDQDRSILCQTDTLKQALQPNGSDTVIYQEKPVHIITWAKRFLFDPDQIKSPVSSFSGGEQARILLARLMMEPADVLLLDEPTNDLDIASLEVLEQALIEFPGAIVFSTHDRLLMEHVATEILAFEDDQKVVPYADVQQWLQRRKQKSPGKSQKETKEKPRKEKSNKKRLTYKDQYELDHIEKNIAEAEKTVVELEKKTQDSAVLADPEELKLVCEKLTNAHSKVERLYARWQDLEDKKA